MLDSNFMGVRKWINLYINSSRGYLYFIILNILCSLHSQNRMMNYLYMNLFSQYDIRGNIVGERFWRHITDVAGQRSSEGLINLIRYL